MPASATRFDKFVALATRLVAKNAESVTHQSRGAAAFIDPAQEWLGKATTTSDTTVDGVFVNRTELADLIRNMDISDTFGSIARDSSGVLIAAEGLAGTAIKIEDKIIRGSDTWEVRTAEVIQPATVPILWIVEIGK